MDQLSKKQLTTSRGFKYTYYISPSSTANTTKPAILLTHGWPDDASLWQYIIPHLLKTKNRLIAPDLLGSGGTSKPTDPAAFEIKAMVTDVNEILSAENITQKIIPLGHDWGAFFASRFYMLNKPRMAGVISLNVAWGPPSTEPFDLDATNAALTQAIGYPGFAYWELFADPKVGEVMDSRLDSLWHAIHGQGDDWMKQLFCSHGAIKSFLLENRTDVPLRPFAQNEKLKADFIASKKADGMTSQGCWYRATKENYHLETEKTLDGNVTTPYLFIGCDGDAVCRTDYIELPKQLGLIREEDLEVHELHSGHWCPYEKPEEVAGLVVKWLGKHGFSG